MFVSHFKKCSLQMKVWFTYRSSQSMPWWITQCISLCVRHDNCTSKWCWGTYIMKLIWSIWWKPVCNQRKLELESIKKFSNEACTTDLRMSAYIHISQYLQELWLNEQQIRTCNWMYTKQHLCSKILKIWTEAECVTHDLVCQKNAMDYESA